MLRNTISANVLKGGSKEWLFRECHEGKRETLNEGLSHITSNVYNTEQINMINVGLCLDDRAKHKQKN